MKRTKMIIGALVGCLVASLLWAAPSAADPTTIWVDGRNTEVPIGCARTGTGATSQHPTWQNVSYPYSASQEDLPGAPSVTTCAQAIFDAMVELAADEENINDQFPVHFRNQLLSGTVDLTSPYQVYLNNVYLSLPVLASMSETAPGASSGLGSCTFEPYVFIINCQDDAGGRVMLRDEYGNPVRDWNNEPIYIYLNGLLSQRGATMYASVLLQNDEGPGAGLSEDTQKHEQVHAQQWAKWGWNFGNMFLSEAAGDPGDAVWHWWTTGVQRDPVCFNVFERAAKFAWTGYPCPHNWT